MKPTIVVLGVFLTGCQALEEYGARAIQQRQLMNDLQARATLHATCDISVGSYFRELNTQERNFVAGVCGGPELLEVPR